MANIFDKISSEETSKSQGAQTNIFDKISLESSPSSSPSNLIDKFKSYGKEAGRHIARGAHTIGTRLLGSPGDIQSFLDSMANKAIGYASGVPEEQLQGASFFGPKIPNTEQIRSSTRELAPEILKPHTEGEAKFDDLLDTFTSLATPGPGGKVKLGRALIGTALGELAHGLSEGTGEGTQEIVKIVGNMLPFIVEGKLKPTTKEAQELYQYGKAAGMTDKQLTPLLQKEGRVKNLGKFAAKTSKAEKQVEEVGNKLGEMFQETEKGFSNIHLPAESQFKIYDSFENVLHELQRSHAPAPEKVEAIEILKNQLKNIRNRGLESETLIPTYRDINRSYGRAGASKPAMERVKKEITHALHEINPELAKNFELENKLYSKFAEFRDVFGDPRKTDIATQLIEGVAGKGEIAAWANAIMSASPSKLGKLLGYVTTRRLATKMLTDPHWQSITRNIMRASTQNSDKAMRLAIKQLEKQKNLDFPEED